MHKLSLARAVRLLLIPLIFTACSSPKKQTKNEFNSYLPPSFEENFEKYSPEERSTEKETPSDIWDLSDVDISYVEKERKLIAFTFDDAPAKYMENMLAVFASFNEAYPTYRASATFFVNGCRADATAFPLLHTANILGFELGNHTQRHFDLTKLSEDILDQEIDETDALLARIDGKERHLLRAPFGNTNEAVRAHASAPIIDWTIDTLDWTGISADEIYEKVFQNRFSGAIVLMHDSRATTVDAVKRLLPDLMQDGYQVVGVSQLAKAHNCVLKNGSVYIRARKR